MVIAYLMKYGINKELENNDNIKMSYQKALEFVQQRRSIVNPNSGFVESLKKWECIKNEFQM